MEPDRATRTASALLALAVMALMVWSCVVASTVRANKPSIPPLPAPSCNPSGNIDPDYPDLPFCGDVLTITPPPMPTPPDTATEG